MLFSQLRLSVLLCALLSLLMFMSAEARVSVIVSVAPPVQEVVVEPVGSDYRNIENLASNSLTP